jgi:tetratricopeptide (TPR) repeat protein
VVLLKVKRQEFCKAMTAPTAFRVTRLRVRTRRARMGRVFACALSGAVPALAGQQVAPAPDVDPIGEYLTAIERAESLGGAYAAELVDLYYGMGQSLLEQGDTEAARDALYRTVMVARVNAGPNSLEQTPYLYSIADLELRLGNRSGAIDVLDNIYVIHARHYGEDNPALLPTVEKIYDWYVDQLSPVAVPLLPADLQNLSYLMGRAAALTEAEYGLGDARTALRYRELGQIHYQAIRYFTQTGQSPNPELVLPSEGSSNLALLEQATIDHLKAGEAAFERAVLAWRENPAATDLERAEAMAELGDWYLVFKYFRKARRQYEEAYRLLAHSDDYRGLAESYLGVPAPLRFLNREERFARDLSPAPAGGLEVSMAVSLTGRLYDVEIVRAPEAVSPEQLTALKSHLESTRFRPAVVNGRSQSVSGYVWKALAQDSEDLPWSG